MQQNRQSDGLTASLPNNRYYGQCTLDFWAGEFKQFVGSGEAGFLGRAEVSEQRTRRAYVSPDYLGFLTAAPGPGRAPLRPT